MQRTYVVRFSNCSFTRRNKFITNEQSRHIGRVSYLIYVSMRHYALTTSGDIVECFHTAVCMSC